MFQKIDEDKCEYLKDNELPKLVLALNEEYQLKDKNGWIYVSHQTAGHGCHHHHMLAKILTPKKKVSANMRNLSEKWFESDAGMFEVSLDNILEYRKDLKKMFRVDCNNSYMGFEEGIYPIDCTKKNLSKMCKDDLPEDLDDLISWKNKTDSFFHLLGRWNLYILGENCD